MALFFLGTFVDKFCFTFEVLKEQRLNLNPFSMIFLLFQNNMLLMLVFHMKSSLRQMEICKVCFVHVEALQCIFFNALPLIRP